MTDYKRGDRVRVTFEAEVNAVTHGYVLLKDGEGVIEQAGTSWIIEKLTPDYEQQVRDLEPGTAFAMHSMAGPVTNFIRTKSGFYGGRWDKHEDFTGIAWQNVSGIRVLS